MTTDEELRRRRMQDAARGAGPAVSPAAPGGRPERPGGLVPAVAPAALAAAAGIMPAATMEEWKAAQDRVIPEPPPPRYGSLSYTRADGSRYEVAGNQASNIVPAAGGLFRVPSSTAPGQTPNFDSRVPDDPARQVAPLAAAPGMERRRAPATGAEVQMPADAWDRRDAAVRQRAAGGGIVTAAPGDTAAYAGAAGQARGALGGGPALNPREAARMADLDATRGLRWNPSGPTSAVTRAVGLFQNRAAEEAEAARRRDFQGGLVRQQGESAERQEAIKAAGGVAERVFEAQGRLGEAREMGAAERDVAGTKAGADKYAADKAAGTELAKSEREAAARREEADRDRALKVQELEMRYGQDKSAMSAADISAVVAKDGAAVRMARDAMSRQFDADPAKNAKKRRQALDKLAEQLYGKGADAGYLEGVVASMGPYVDLQDQRAGVQVPGAAARPGSTWEKR